MGPTRPWVKPHLGPGTWLVTAGDALPGAGHGAGDDRGGARPRVGEARPRPEGVPCAGYREHHTSSGPQGHTVGSSSRRGTFVKYDEWSCGGAKYFEERVEELHEMTWRYTKPRRTASTTE